MRSAKFNPPVQSLNRRELLRRTCALVAAFPDTVRGRQEPLYKVSAQPTVALPPELARVLTDYEKLWTYRDSEALAALFTEDGIVLSPGNPMVRGRAAIERFYRGSGSPVCLRAVAFAMEGRVSYIIGGFSREAGALDIGKFTLTLRRNATGRWLIQSDMDNGNSR
jgi:ketosteroid isomerase-like protein